MYTKPIEALYEAMQRGLLSSGPRKPGIIIEKCPPELRSLLEKLTSDDARKMRY